MKLTWLAVLFATALWFAGIAARGEDAQTLKVTVTPKIKVTLSIPKGWEAKVLHPVESLPPLVNIKTPPDAEAGTVTAGPPALLEMGFGSEEWDPLMATRKELDAMIRDSNERYAADSVEKKVTLVEMKSKSGLGAYSVFTDPKLAKAKAVPEGDFRYFVTGIFVNKKLGIMFELHVNDLKGREFQQAMKFIEEGITVE